VIRLKVMHSTIRIFLSVFSLLVSIISIGQSGENNILEGTLLDRDTGKSIAYASIYVQKEAIGTTSNEQGAFIFHLPPLPDTTQVTISMIGYNSLTKTIGSFKKNELIYLNSEINTLNEVLISTTKEKKLTAKQIVKRAYGEIKNNYPSRPYILEGFVRDLQIEDEKYVEFLECATKFYYLPYHKKSAPQVELVAVRTSEIGPKHKWNSNESRKNSIIDLIEDDFIRYDYGPIKSKGGWKYEIEDIVIYDNRLVYKIIGIDRPFQTATLYIDTDSFAFIRMELTRSKNGNRSWARQFTNGALQAHYNVVFEYQEIEGKMFLKYQKEEDTWEIYNGLGTKNLLFTKYPKKELFINKVITKDIDAYPFTKNMDTSLSIEDQKGEYNEPFWSSYNAPRQTETQSKIISELKKNNY